MRAKYVSVRHASTRGVAERYRAQYERDGKWVSHLNGDSLQTYNALCALGETPDVAKVAEVIGNKSWSYLICDGCNDYVTTAVCIGESTYDEPKSYCATCIKEAAALLADVE